RRARRRLGAGARLLGPLRLLPVLLGRRARRRQLARHLGALGGQLLALLARLRQLRLRRRALARQLGQHALLADPPLAGAPRRLRGGGQLGRRSIARAVELDQRRALLGQRGLSTAELL